MHHIYSLHYLLDHGLLEHLLHQSLQHFPKFLEHPEILGLPVHLENPELLELPEVQLPEIPEILVFLYHLEHHPCQ
jgi:hypothetical protein